MGNAGGAEPNVMGVAGHSRDKCDSDRPYLSPRGTVEQTKHTLGTLEVDEWLVVGVLAIYAGTPPQGSYKLGL